MPLPLVRTVDVPWDLASEQFTNFIPYPTKQTEDVFPNCGSLHDDSFGALVSLVYNRGSAISRNSQRRREMYEIQQLMKTRNFGEIPARIRSMKRLWENDPNARGLLKRREAEALLFERGLRST
jgi:GH24 family phage-related lysozyme (muramidase)